MNAEVVMGWLTCAGLVAFSAGSLLWIYVYFEFKALRRADEYAEKKAERELKWAVENFERELISLAARIERGTDKAERDLNLMRLEVENATKKTQSESELRKFSGRLDRVELSMVNVEITRLRKQLADALEKIIGKRKEFAALRQPDDEQTDEQKGAQA